MEYLRVKVYQKLPATEGICKTRLATGGFLQLNHQTLLAEIVS